MNSDLMTIPEVMEYFKVTRMCVFKWSKKGILKKVKVGGKVFYRRSEVIEIAK